MTNPRGQPASRSTRARPRSVSLALGLLIAALGVGAVLALVRLVTAPPPEGDQPARWATAVVFLVAYAVGAGLLAALFYRRRWAWWIWVVLSVLALVYFWSDLQRSLDQGAAYAVQFLLLTAADTAATVLLLLRPSRQWYGVGHKRREPRPPVRSDEYDYPNWP